LTDKEILLEPMNQLRAVYPNLLQLRTRFQNVEVRDHDQIDEKTLRQDDLTLFQSFYQQVMGEKLGKKQEKALTALLENLELDSREGWGDSE